MKLGFSLMENNYVLEKYLLWAWIQSMFVSQHLSWNQGWEAESGTLFAHSWLHILTGFHPTGAGRDGRPKAGVGLCVAVSDHCVGSWASNVVTTCINSYKITMLPLQRLLLVCQWLPLLWRCHTTALTQQLCQSPSVLCNLLGKALLTLGQPPNMLRL